MRAGARAASRVCLCLRCRDLMDARREFEEASGWLPRRACGRWTTCRLDLQHSCWGCAWDDSVENGRRGDALTWRLASHASACFLHSVSPSTQHHPKGAPFTVPPPPCLRSPRQAQHELEEAETRILRKQQQQGQGQGPDTANRDKGKGKGSSKGSKTKRAARKRRPGGGGGSDGSDADMDLDSNGSGSDADSGSEDGEPVDMDPADKL